MATAAPKQCPEDSVNSQECPVCMERYRDPRVLQCAHHFCKVCLEEIADRHPQGSVTCPTCRHVTPIEGDTGVSCLAKYRVVNDFIGNVNAAIEGNPNVKLDNRNCDVCKVKGAQATRVCFECRLCLCDSCNDHKHARFNSFREHKTFPISAHIFCDTHEKCFNLVVCKTCEQICCSLSAMDKHSNHECHPLERKTSKHKELNDVRSRMKNPSEDRMNEKIRCLLKKAKKTQLDFQVAIDRIKASLKLLEAKVINIEEEVIRNVSAEIKHLEMTSCDLDDYKDSKQKLEKHLVYLCEEASYQELFVRQKEFSNYDRNFYKQLISKPEIALPVLGNTLSDVAAWLDRGRQELGVLYDVYIITN